MLGNSDPYICCIRYVFDGWDATSGRYLVNFLGDQLLVQSAWGNRPTVHLDIWYSYHHKRAHDVGLWYVDKLI